MALTQACAMCGLQVQADAQLIADLTEQLHQEATVRTELEAQVLYWREATQACEVRINVLQAAK